MLLLLLLLLFYGSNYSVQNVKHEWLCLPDKNLINFSLQALCWLLEKVPSVGWK